MDGPPIARGGRFWGGGFTLLQLQGAPAILPGLISATHPSQQPFALYRPEEWGAPKEASWGKLEGRGVRPRHRGQETPAAVHGHLSSGGEASDGATPKGRARPRSPSRYPPFHTPPRLPSVHPGGSALFGITIFMARCFPRCSCLTPPLTNFHPRLRLSFFLVPMWWV